ncbi:MAG: hypothetical protein ABIJ34_07135 [archaeon]
MDGNLFKKEKYIEPWCCVHKHVESECYIKGLCAGNDGVNIICNYYKMVKIEKFKYLDNSIFTIMTRKHDFKTRHGAIFERELTEKDVDLYNTLVTAFILESERTYSPVNMERKLYRAVTNMINENVLEEIVHEGGAKLYTFAQKGSKYSPPSEIQEGSKHFADLATNRYRIYNAMADAFTPNENDGFTKREIVKYFRKGIRTMRKKGIIRPINMHEQEGKQYLTQKLISATRAAYGEDIHFYSVAARQGAHASV